MKAPKGAVRIDIGIPEENGRRSRKVCRASWRTALHFT